MTVTAVQATTPGLLTTPSTSSATSQASQLDQQTFLQLLVAQLRNQDPMNPTDSSEFLAQSAQFTALEKMQAVADQTAQLLSAQVAFGASSLVGKSVSYPTSAGDQASGVVQSVRFDATGPVLVVDGTDVAVASVRSVAAGASG